MQRKQIYYFASFHSRSQTLKERICSSRSKFFPLRVDISKSYLIQRSKQEFIQSNISLIFVKRQGALIRAGVFIRINMIGCATKNKIFIKYSEPRY